MANNSTEKDEFMEKIRTNAEIALDFDDASKFVKRKYHIDTKAKKIKNTGELLDHLKFRNDVREIIEGICQDQGKTWIFDKEEKIKEQHDIVSIRAETEKKKSILILATKDHEAQVFEDFIKDHPVYFGKLDHTPVFLGNLNNQGYLFQTWNFPKFSLIVATLKNVQGPVVAASRTANIIAQLQPTYIGMIGICGGRELGTVKIAHEAIDPWHGRVKVPEQKRRRGTKVEVYDEICEYQGQKYFLVNKTDGAWNVREGPAASKESLEAFAKDISKKVNLRVELATFFMANQVREDLEEVLFRLSSNPDHAVIDMESCAFYQAVRYALPKSIALPVIKGVSDVGNEISGKDKNPRNEPADEQLREKNYKEFAAHVSDSDIQSHEDKRREYRKVAGKRAALVMVEYIYLGIQDGTIQI